MQRIPLTPEGLQKLKDNVEDLIKVQRPANIKAIAEARAHGDLSENAEYHAAKERQSFIEGKVQELQGKIAMAEVIDPSKIKQDKIAFGATVKLLDLDTDDEKTYMLVGPEEADIKAGRISIHSPIGKALISRAVGDEVTVKVPARTIEYEVLEIRFE
ncbi:MAG: transcription elongation factor GreA [Nitrospira sp.]|nr:transcription elongation factor GreA [bacterium]MBL7049339.1 transcription elongation factor GreA [Nitrospira sp.]